MTQQHPCHFDDDRSEPDPQSGVRLNENADDPTDG